MCAELDMRRIDKSRYKRPKVRQALHITRYRDNCVETETDSLYRVGDNTLDTTRPETDVMEDFL